MKLQINKSHKFYYKKGAEREMKTSWVKKAVVCGLILMFFGADATVNIGSYKINASGTSQNHVGQYYQHKANTMSTETYQLLIIAPTIFSEALQPLINHKNRTGIITKPMTTEYIYEHYSGKDKAEQIKYAIKDALEQWGIKYVLLVGGLTGYQSNPNDENDWHVPARYSHLDLDGYPEPKYLSDLYFADIYDSTGEFSSWDTYPYPDGNGIFGEWRWIGGQECKDERDLIPDVCIGRWPCRNTLEVNIIVWKDIFYESGNHKNTSWFKTILCVGGDSLDDSTPGNNGFIEGKVAGLRAGRYIQNRDNFTVVGLWPHENSTTTDLTLENFLKYQSQGSGFTFLSGHGNPGEWFTHPKHADFHNLTLIHGWNILQLSNFNKLPIAIVGGCNVATFDKNLSEGAPYFTADCFCWKFTRKLFGGCIASIGNTAVGKGEKGGNFTSKYDGFMQTRFFEIYGNVTEVLGEVWKGEITQYVETFTAADDMLHCKVVETWVLLGDPSLRIGGISN